MHHMAGTGNAMKIALGNVPMKSVRLLIDVDEPIFLARDDADGHLQVRILIPELDGTRNHESGFRG